MAITLWIPDGFAGLGIALEKPMDAARPYRSTARIRHRLMGDLERLEVPEIRRQWMLYMLSQALEPEELDEVMVEFNQRQQQDGKSPLSHSGYRLRLL